MKKPSYDDISQHPTPNDYLAELLDEGIIDNGYVQGYKKSFNRGIDALLAARAEYKERPSKKIVVKAAEIVLTSGWDNQIGDREFCKAALQLAASSSGKSEDYAERFKSEKISMLKMASEISSHDRVKDLKKNEHWNPKTYNKKTTPLSFLMAILKDIRRTKVILKLKEERGELQQQVRTLQLKKSMADVNKDEKVDIPEQIYQLYMEGWGKYEELASRFGRSTKSIGRYVRDRKKRDGIH